MTWLFSLVSLMRSHGWYDLVIPSLRAIVASRLVVEHSAVLDAIKARNPDEARLAMASHISSLECDINGTGINVLWKRALER